MKRFKIVSKKRYKKLIDDLVLKRYIIGTYNVQYSNIIKKLLEHHNVYGDGILIANYSPYELIEELDKRRYQEGYEQALYENKATIKEHEKTIEKQDEEIKELIEENNDLHQYIRNHEW